MARKKGAILLALFTCMVHVSPSKMDDESVVPVEISDEEIQDQTSAAATYHFSTQDLLNLEKLLEDPQLESAFADLSQEEREDLIKTIELFNESFRQALDEVAQDVQEA